MPTTESIYYPALSELISTDDLPEILSFIKDGIQQMFDNIYLNNLQYSKSIGGNSAFYSLEIISAQKIQVDLFDSGIYLVLNPDYTNDSVSSFPITIFWEWDIIKYVNYFATNTFSFSASDLFNLALLIFNVTEKNALKAVAHQFFVPAGPSITVLQQLVSGVNSLYGSAIVVDDFSNDPYYDLVNQINGIGQSVFATIFTLYISNSDPTTALNNLNTFFEIGV